MTDLTTTGITLDYAQEPTKKQIIQRLFEQHHITFNEMWTLLLNEPDVRYVPMPYAGPTIITPYVPDQPYTPPYSPEYPWTISCNADNNQRVHNSSGGTGDTESYKNSK